MKKIELFEQAIRDENCLMPCALMLGYIGSVEAQNEHINIFDPIEERDIDEIAETLIVAGVGTITISSKSGDMIEKLARFEKHGFKVTGMVDVQMPYKEYRTGGFRKTPAVKLVRG